MNKKDSELEIQSKSCSQCNNTKLLEDFPFIKKRGYRSTQCRLCLNAKTRTRRSNGYYKRIKELRNRPEAKLQEKLTQKRYRQNNRDKMNKYSREYYLKNKRALKLKRAIYNEKNREKLRAWDRKWRKNKYRTCVKFNLNTKMSRHIGLVLKANKNNKTWESLVGYGLDELQSNISKKFTDGMSWEKYVAAEIVIDHILPKELFEYTSPQEKQFKMCWSLDNLRPVWVNDNSSKSDFLPDGRRARNLSKEEKAIFIEKYFNSNQPI